MYQKKAAVIIYKSKSSISTFPLLPFFYLFFFLTRIFICNSCNFIQNLTKQGIGLNRKQNTRKRKEEKREEKKIFRERRLVFPHHCSIFSLEATPCPATTLIANKNSRKHREEGGRRERNKWGNVARQFRHILRAVYGGQPYRMTNIGGIKAWITRIYASLCQPCAPPPISLAALKDHRFPPNPSIAFECREFAH